MFVARWDYVMKAMIWSFNEIVNPTPSGKRFYNKEGEFDRQKAKKFDAKLQKGLTLFGKYFSALWD